MDGANVVCHLGGGVAVELSDPDRNACSRAGDRGRHTHDDRNFQGIRFEALTSFLRVAWAGFLINALSGVALFTSQATTFVTNRPFLIKISLIFLAAICTAMIQQKMRDSAESWNDSGVPGAVKTLAAVSILFWLGAIIAGRLTAYIA
jgi:hypothetical protein